MWHGFYVGAVTIYWHLLQVSHIFVREKKYHGTLHNLDTGNCRDIPDRHRRWCLCLVKTTDSYPSMVWNIIWINVIIIKAKCLKLKLGEVAIDSPYKNLINKYSYFIWTKIWSLSAGVDSVFIELDGVSISLVCIASDICICPLDHTDKIPISWPNLNINIPVVIWHAIAICLPSSALPSL